MIQKEVFIRAIRNINITLFFHRAISTSHGNEKILHISQSITGASPSDWLVSYPGHLMWRDTTPLQRCSQCILQPQSTGPQEGSEFKSEVLSRKTDLSLCPACDEVSFKYVVKVVMV